MPLRADALPGLCEVDALLRGDHCDEAVSGVEGHSHPLFGRGRELPGASGVSNLLCNIATHVSSIGRARPPYLPAAPPRALASAHSSIHSGNVAQIVTVRASPGSLQNQNQ